MAPKKGGNTYGQSKSINPLESLKDLSGSIGQGTVDSLRDLGSGVLDQLLGMQSGSEDENANQENEQKPVEQVKEAQKKIQKEANLFNYQNHHENVIVREQVKQLIEQIRQEVQYIKKADKSLLNEVKDIEKFTLETVSEKPGIYHVKFLEIVLRILRSVRMKVGESRTWLQAMVSKKKKRGSLFASRSKKQGTAYSMSQELSNARSIQ
jgi:hypothetical protein